ncbi:MAG: alpha/beta fold hydrolase [Acidimicrobiales bacterium]|nr:alpha/beta fold hydrolase [Acidimicrobiales bacterium]
MSESVLSRHELSSVNVVSPMTYELLQPADLEPGSPVLLWLHGGDGPEQFTPQTRPAFEQCWGDGSLPPMSVVIPHSTRSFWLDGVGENAAWETMLTEELLPRVREQHGGGDVAVTGGISMGGMGSLRLAFRHPELFAAVVSMEPGIEPTEIYGEVRERDRVFRRDGVMEALFGDPVDASLYRRNHPVQVAMDNAVDIVASGLAIYLECGDEDFLHLQNGTEALHRRLWDVGIRHEYRSVRGGNHIGRSLGPRLIDALRFLGRSLEEATEDEQLSLVKAGLPQFDLTNELKRETVIEGPTGPIQVWEYGDGEPVLLIPSLGRGAADFEDLARRLAYAGYHAIYPEPRGINGSTGDLRDLSMADLAADAAAVVHAVANGPVTIVGHAFGNRVSRMTATDYPHLVDSVVLLCCGGQVRPAPEHEEALIKVFDVEASDEDHLAAVDLAFFAEGNDASVWFDGWHGVAAAGQGAATASQPIEHWWGAGGKDLFIVQPDEDVMAVTENAQNLCAAFPDRASMVMVKHAGHALLPEQPEAVEVAVRSWLTRVR